MSNVYCRPAQLRKLSKGQIDQHKLAAGHKSLFRHSVEEILKGQVIIRSQAFATFSATEFSWAGRKDLAGRMRPAGRMLCRPGLLCIYVIQHLCFGNIVFTYLLCLLGLPLVLVELVTWIFCSIC